MEKRSGKGTLRKERNRNRKGRGRCIGDEGKGGRMQKGRKRKRTKKHSSGKQEKESPLKPKRRES